MAWWNRIKVRLLLFGITMSILPILIIGWYNLTVVKDWLILGVKEKEAAIVERASADMEASIEGLMERMSYTADLNLLEEAGDFGQGFPPPSLTRWEISLYRLLKQNPEIENLYLFDRAGKVILPVQRFSVSWPEQIPSAMVERLRVKAKGEMEMGDLHYAKDGTPYLSVGLPFFSKTGEWIGGLMAEVNFKGTFAKISSIHLGEKGYLYLIDAERKLIAHTFHSEVLQKKEVIRAPELQDMVNKKCATPVPALYTGYTGKRVIGVYAPIPTAGWGVVVEQPLEEVYAPIQQLLSRILLMMLIVMGTVVSLSILFGIRFTRPIEKMERAVQKVTAGELGSKITHPAGDEFGRLAKAFNKMTDELVEKQRRLEQEKERLDTIINGSGAGFALLRDDFTVTWMNERLRMWLGDAHESFPCYHLFAGRHIPCADCPLLPGTAGRLQNEVITKLEVKGAPRIFRHRIYPLENVIEEEGEYLVVVEDITEHKKMEEMVFQADKLSAIGMLASGLAHEMNNPLASIYAYAEDLEERLTQQEGTPLPRQELEKYMEVIRGNVERCKKITDSLLHFSRKSASNKEEIDLEERIRESLLLVGHELKRKQIRIINQVGKLPRLQGDPLQVQQVFVNIIQNAVDAMAEGKELTLQSAIDREWIRIIIKDQGVGMSSEQMKMAFDPFFTTKPVGKGTGLGLYIAYQVMKKMGGEIILESSQGEGTTVTLLFPLREEGTWRGEEYGNGGDGNGGSSASSDCR